MYRRKNSLRWEGYDYSKKGWYFVTVCTKGMREWFGRCDDGEMELNEVGRMVELAWKDIPKHFAYVVVDEYIVMPNHIHGIVVITSSNVRAQHAVPVHGVNVVPVRNFQNIVPGSLSTVVRSFKSACTRSIRKLYPDFLWHRSFYDRVIRNDRELVHIRTYIRNNPGNWKLDRYFR